jgi:hypothetical protein
MKIYDSTFDSNSAGFVSHSKNVPRNFLNSLRSNSRRGTCNLKGGAIVASDGANLEICASQFISDNAYFVSRFCSCYLAVL